MGPTAVRVFLQGYSFTYVVGEIFAGTDSCQVEGQTNLDFGVIAANFRLKRFNLVKAKTSSTSCKPIKDCDRAPPMTKSLCQIHQIFRSEVLQSIYGRVQHKIVYQSYIPAPNRPCFLPAA